MNTGSNNPTVSPKRIEQLQLFYRMFLAALFFVSLFVLILIYFILAGISINTNMRSLPLHIDFGLFAVIGAAILITSISSGALWARFAKKSLAVTQDEMHALFISKSQTGQLDPETEEAIKNHYR